MFRFLVQVSWDQHDYYRIWTLTDLDFDSTFQVFPGQREGSYLFYRTPATILVLRGALPFRDVSTDPLGGYSIAWLTTRGWRPGPSLVPEKRWSAPGVPLGKVSSGG